MKKKLFSGRITKFIFFNPLKTKKKPLFLHFFYNFLQLLDLFTVFLYGFSIAALSWKKVCLNLLRYPLQIQEGLGEDLALCA